MKSVEVDCALIDELECNGIKPIDIEKEYMKILIPHCHSCKIKLNLQNSMNGVECMMCAMPAMALYKSPITGGIIETHFQGSIE